MERQIVYEDKNLKLEYVAQGNYIHETWWGSTPGDAFQKLLNIIVQNLEKFNADGLLLDAREHKGLGPESQKIAAETIGKFAKAHGSLKEAIIVPMDVFSKFSVENYSKHVAAESAVNTRFFNNIADAETWLKEK